MRKILALLTAMICLNADSLLIGAGGGYKKPVLAVMQNLKADGVNIDAAFANLAQIVAQAKQSDMSVIVGDEAFLQKTDLAIKGYERIGKGELVLVTPKNKPIKSLDELKNLAKIAVPDAKKAIYGIRAEEFFKNSNLTEALKDKILPVAGVPQVVTYVLNGEVDAGFINSTEALARAGEFGSVIYIDPSLYSPVFISAAKLEMCDKNALCEKFLTELKSERSKKIFADFGLK